MAGTVPNAVPPSAAMSGVGMTGTSAASRKPPTYHSGASQP